MSGAIRTTCPYCGVGCGIQAQADDSGVRLLQGDEAHPANRGSLCVKGTQLVQTPIGDNRLQTPRYHGEDVSWSTAIDLVATRFKQTVERFGADAVAFYLSGQLLTEDYYVANKLMKGFIGSANVDTNSRLCMASAVAAHKRAFGEDVVPCQYSDLDMCDLVVLVGSNAAWAHPVVYQRITARQSNGLRVVVIDPRSTATTESCDLHLPIKPGSDGLLFAGLCHYLSQHALDREFVQHHTEGFDSVDLCAVEIAEVVAGTGVDVERITQFYRWFAQTQRTVTVFSQGINQSTSGTDKANAIINCHLVTGRIGQPGMGPFSMTGQPNAMGGREVGGMANQLAAHMDFEPSDIDRVQRFWQAPNMATKPGLKAVDMFDALHDGRIKAIWIMGTNPAVSLPNATKVRQALQRAPFVVVSDCVENSDTLALADLALPAQAWGEKSGTVTNSERCISRQRRLSRPIGESRPDWQIVSEVASAMGYASAFNYTSEREVFIEHARLTAFENQGRRCLDLQHLKDLSEHAYDTLQPTYWPQEGRPFTAGRFATASHRAQFVGAQPASPHQQVKKPHQLVLNTGRIRDQWHTMTKTGTAAVLFQHQDAPRLQMHPVDAQSRSIANGDLVAVANSLGECRLIVEVTDATQPGYLFAPIHWNDQFASHAVVDRLVQPAVDPLSGQPESKHAIVEIKRLEPAWWVRVAVSAALPVPQLHQTASMQYWTGSPSEYGWQYEMALQDISALVPLLGGSVAAQYKSPKQCRAIGGDAQRSWLFYAAPSRTHLPSHPQLGSVATRSGEAWHCLTLGADRQVDRSPTICTCFEVRRDAIVEAIANGAGDAAMLGQQLSCGTNCGSCIPELNRLVNAQSEVAQVVNQ